MPVPANVVRANLRAVVGAGEEIVHSLHFRRVNTTLPDEGTLQQIADRIRDKWTDMLNVVQPSGVAVKSFMRTDCDYVTVDTYSLDANGHATDQAQSAFGATAQGTSGAVPLPPECALVVSLKTGLPGRSRRGRLYMGGFTNTALIIPGVVATGLAQALATALADFGQEMKYPDVNGIDRLNWSVLSRTLTATYRIEQTAVGNLWDVQRRRQNKLVEAFVSDNITY